MLIYIYILVFKWSFKVSHFPLQAFLIDVFARPKQDAFQRSYTNGGPSSDEAENDEGND